MTGHVAWSTVKHEHLIIPFPSSDQLIYKSFFDKMIKIFIYIRNGNNNQIPMYLLKLIQIDFDREIKMRQDFFIFCIPNIQIKLYFLFNILGVQMRYLYGN